MKTNPSILAVLMVSILTARTQGVIHLGPSDSYLLSHPSVVQGQIDEGVRMFFNVQFGFSGDLFTLGDSLQIDILSSPTSLTPLATGTASNPPWTTENTLGFSWNGSTWNAANGAVRLTMLNGSVDVASVLATTAGNFSLINYSFPVPEPSGLALFGLGALAFGFFRRRNSSQ